ncbi:MAG TPA: HDOD domain-containing protein [Tepidisphaeraceae bacterium]|nr:HDOD domain-containing protein [Tepidisphaeraceae bacterium]
MSSPPDQLREKRVELILQQLDELPTLPAIALRVLEVTGQENSALKQVVELIESDPAITARILQLVHRADVGVTGQVSSMERAVVLLGFEAVRSAVLAISVFQVFSGPSPLPGRQFNRDEFWKHSIAVACCAELLATALKQSAAPAAKGLATVEPSEAFVCGLLHDIGKVALDAALPKSFGRVVEAVDLLRGNIADVERTVIGLDHMVVGKRLAERWQLPPNVRDCIWLHGQLPQALPATVRNTRLVNLITLADILVRERHLGYSGNYSFTYATQNLIEAIGVTSEQVNDAVQHLVEHIEPRAKALGLGQSSSHELYQHALTQANKELGRVSGQLAAKNRRLAIRAKFFDALSGFQGELRADAPPQDVLKAIGATAVAVLDVTSCATFSLLPGQSFAEALLFDSSGDMFQSTLIDCPLRPNRPPAGDGPVLSAGEQLEWLLEAVSPRLGYTNRYWICLEADNQCIGGVLWGGMPGEGQRLSTQVQELEAIAAGWGLALRTAQIREEARTLSEQLAEANRQLHNAQTEILRSKTMISVGEMAAGAAHEMNNPLAVISGRSQLLSQQLTDPKLKGSAHLIYEQSHRLTDIISELMDFAKPIPPAPVPADLAELIDRALHEAKMQVDPADRSIEVTLGDLPTIVVDKQQVTAALTEVIDNALHATDPTKGQITIHAAFDPYSLRVVMTVADNGVGMDEATLKRAFDPFFSSRKAGRRRGMGLAKALRWVEASGGSIRLESRPGQGTRTMVLLPALDRRREPRSANERKAAQ